MKIISWNVNGIRAVIKKNFAEFITEHQPDILCLQETKARAEQVDLPLELSGYRTSVSYTHLTLPTILLV